MRLVQRADPGPAWVFDLVGATPEDTMDDLYPGSGIVGKTWALFAHSENAKRSDRWVDGPGSERSR